MTKKIYTAENIYVARGGGGVIAESKNAIILSEDGRSDRVFFPKSDVAMVLFDPSETLAKDPNLGDAVYYHLAGKSSQVDDVAWSYGKPEDELSSLSDLITFDATKVTVEAF